jgi:DNA-binding XRE family transcriptional regulator
MLALGIARVLSATVDEIFFLEQHHDDENQV